MKVVARLFSPMFTTKDKGPPLELAMGQGIIQEHGGIILANSHTRVRGRTLTIQLPLTEAPD